MADTPPSGLGVGAGRGPTATSSPWDPDQYAQFSSEREQPFWDLCQLLQPVDAPRLVDLGCGDGRLTALLHRRIGASSTLGVDSSDRMLAQAAEYETQAVSFRLGDITEWCDRDIADWSSDGKVEVVFSNAALHWVPDHRRVLSRWCTALAPGGQLAVQMPSNADQPSHRVAAELADELLGSRAPADPVASNVMAPERYAELLSEMGFAHQHVRLQVYGHRLAWSADVVEWVKGTTFTRFRSIMDPDDYAHFVDEYRRRLLAVIGDHRPYFFPFKRILLWGRLG